MGQPASEGPPYDPTRHLRIFLEDAALWPVLFVLLAHVLLAGALLLLALVRGAGPFSAAALALLLALCVEAIRRAQRPLHAFGWVLALWCGAALAAVFGSRLGLL
jgi:hypothetical protein